MMLQRNKNYSTKLRNIFLLNMAIFEKLMFLSKFDDVKILFIYLNISMMLNKILIQWFSIDVTTRSLNFLF